MNRIDGPNIGNLNLEKAGGVPSDANAQSSGQDATRSVDDAVALSGKAKDIQRLNSLIYVSREERIQHVRQMLESGTYRVSSEDVARKLIEYYCGRGL